MEGRRDTFSYRHIIRIAYPIILGSLAQDIITVADTAFVGRLGEQMLGAAAVGAMFYLAVVMTGWGFALGVQIMIARRFGEKEYDSVNAVFLHACVILCVMPLLVFSFLKLSNFSFMQYLVRSDLVREPAVKFLNIRIWGLFPAFLNMAFRSFYIGTANTRIISRTTLLMAALNISLDYALIFGVGFFPRWGLEGAAYASVIAETAAFVFFLVCTVRNKENQRFHLFRRTPYSRKLTGQMFRLSAPLILQSAVAFSAWFIFFLVIEKMGETALAVSNIIRNIYIILLVPITGIASACNTLVSYALGQQRPEKVRLIVWRCLLLAVAGVAIAVGILAFIPRLSLSIFTNSEKLIEVSLPVFYLILFAAFALAFGITMFQAVAGTGNTKVALYMELGIILFYLSYVYFSSKIPGAEVIHVWIAELIYGIGMGILAFLYFRFGQWRRAKV